MKREVLSGPTPHSSPCHAYYLHTCLASSKCSRVWGMGPSLAATTRMQPSRGAVPVIIFWGEGRETLSSIHIHLAKHRSQT